MSLWKDAQEYKPTERVTGSFARRLIQQVGLLQVNEVPLVVLDNACGTGVLSSQLYEMLNEGAKERLQLTCGDLSEPMVQFVQQRIADDGWNDAKALVVDAQRTGLADECFTHVLTNFGFMLMSDPTMALNECFRILKSGGSCGLTTWHAAGWIPDVRESLATIIGPPSLPDDITLLSSVGDGKPWYRAEYVKQKLEGHGFQDVKVEIVSMSFPEDTMAFVAQLSTLPKYFTSKFWSDEDQAEFGGEVMPAIMKYMMGKYGKDFELTMIAIVASARKP